MDGSSHLTRRLAAVVFADVAGYSLLVAANDAGTQRRWKALRTEVLEPLVRQQRGRVVDTAGDALLIEFPSAVHAVQWALDVQRATKAREGSSGPGRLSLRVGITVEDVIVDEGALAGDGVNVAARIHQAAEPGQVVVTAPVRDLVVGRVAATFVDLGAPPLKNIARPVRLFCVEPSMARQEGGLPPYLAWSTRPTLAVLPFRNIGGTELDAYFGEGITEDIITGLSRSRAFYVIARTSTLRYRDRDKDARQIAGELHVQYVLDGTVRRMGARLRITAALVDVAADRTIWGERYDGGAEDVFAFQDRIVASITNALEPRLQAAEAARVRGRPTDSLDAYDCVLQALSRLYDFTVESYRETGELLDRAVVLDQNYAQAHAYAAWRLNFWVGEGLSPDPAADRERGLTAARRAIALDPEDAFALTVAGHLTSFFARRPEEAMELFGAALEINENSAFAWALSALTLSYRGEADEAVGRMQNVWRLSPFDPLNFYFWIIAGIAEFVAGRHNEAVAWLRKSRRANPRFVASQRMLAASLALLGDEAGARAIARELLDLDPSFRVSTFVAWYPLRRPGDLERLGRGLRAAGLPQ